jgi:phosphoglycerate dehydrogenase-like enzyme
MDKLTIVITCKLDDSNKARIAAVSPLFKVVDAAEVNAAEQGGDYSRKAEFDAILSRADIVYGLLPPEDLIGRAPRLKWIQTVLAGVDQEIYADIFKSPVIVTNTSGMHGIQITELVFTMISMFAKRSPFSLKCRSRRDGKGSFPC